MFFDSWPPEKSWNVDLRPTSCVSVFWGERALLKSSHFDQEWVSTRFVGVAVTETAPKTSTSQCMWPRWSSTG